VISTRSCKQMCQATMSSQKTAAKVTANANRLVSLSHIKAPEPDAPTAPPPFLGSRCVQFRSGHAAWAQIDAQNSKPSIFSWASCSHSMIEQFGKMINRSLACRMAHPGGKITSNKPQALAKFLAKKQGKGEITALSLVCCGAG